MVESAEDDVDVAEEVKAANADLENVGKGLDSYGKESGQNGVASELGRKRRRLYEKERVSGCMVEFVGRVLRSRSASTGESRKISCELDRVIPCGNHDTESVDKSLKLMKGDSDDSGVVLETTVKRKRGRPPKVNVGSEATESKVAVVTRAFHENLNVVKANSDDSNILQVTAIKRKRGRPPKVNVASETTESNVAIVTRALDESLNVVKAYSDDSDILQVPAIKRKRGRPPKVNVASETTESNVAIVTRALDESLNVVKANSDDLDILQVTAIKRKRGRPPKVNLRSDTTESNVAIVTMALDESLNLVKANSDGSDILQVTAIKRKRGRPPKVNLRSDTTEPVADVVTEALNESLNVAKANSDDSDVVQVTAIKRKRGRPPKVNVGSEITGPGVAVPTKALNESLSEVKASSDDSDVVLVTSVEGKRRGPFKMKAKSVDTESEVAVAVKVKGRCRRTSMKPKTEAIETNHAVPKTMTEKKNKKKQGRCPKSKPWLRRFNKIQGTSWGRKVVNNLQGKSFAPHASKYDSYPNHAVSSKDINVASENVMKERTLHLKRLTSPAENKISDFVDGNHGSSSRTNLVQPREEDREKTRGCGKSTEKHLIREQIKDMLLSAGWTIEYRPRMGREYADAIYVSPQGRAYWSVTLAYSVLKSHYENIDATSLKVKSEFTFKPVPEDAMKLLARTTKKKKESIAKLGLHESDTGNNNNRKSGSTKHCMRNAGSSHGTQNQKFVVDSNGKASRGKSKKAHSKRQRALLVRDSKKGIDGSGSFDTYPGKRMVLNWMIDLGTVPLGVSVHYRGPHQKTRRTHAGRIVRDGIYCGCCNEIVTLSEFQVHGRGKSDSPSQYIYLEDGTSLLQCQLLTWDKEGDSQCKRFHSLSVTCDDPNDDSCGICGNGGELICCDGCTSTFHLDCLNISKYPSGEWHCLYCSCKFCGQVGEGSCQGNIDGFETFLLSTCQLCEAKYHKLCIQTNLAGDDAFDFSSFCGTECQEVLNQLMSLVGVKHELTDGYSWTLLHRFDVGSDSNHSEMPLKVECNSKLAVAFSIMDECFLPIIDHRTGIDLINNVVYNCGSNFTRLNYSGFYTVILEKGDELISAASIRVHGDGLAEMPFIGTRHNYRRQGMCSKLLGAVEDALRSFGVKKLVIPAISELLHTWTSVFGFEPLRADDRQKLKNVNLLVFPCTDMLQKTILETRQEQPPILPTDAARKQDNLDSRSYDEPETSFCNEDVCHLKMNIENEDLGTQRDGFCGSDCLSVDGTAQTVQRRHEVPPCITDVSHASEATLVISESDT